MMIMLGGFRGGKPLLFSFCAAPTISDPGDIMLRFSTSRDILIEIYRAKSGSESITTMTRGTTCSWNICGFDPDIINYPSYPEAAGLVDFIVGVEENRAISILHNPRGIRFA